MANVKLVSPQAYDVRITAQINNGLAVNARTPGNIEVAAGVPAVVTQLIPGNEIWHVEDIFNPGADPEPCVGAQIRVELMVNGAAQPFSPTMVSINIADPTRLRLPRSIMMPPAASLNVNFVNVAVTTSTCDVAVHLKCMRYPTQPGAEG